MQQNILICLEKLGIGGVETAVVNQAISLKNMGNNVVVMGKEGTYIEVLNKYGIDTINFDFTLINKFDTDNEDFIYETIKKYEINQIHIHQFPCIQYLWTTCIKYNIPYVAFVHSISMHDFPWFFNAYPIYKNLLDVYFQNAEKIIVLAEEAIKKHQEHFPNIPTSKYYVLPNSINFSLYMSKKNVKEINKFLLISRMSNEKVTGIKNSIDIFLKYVSKKNKRKVILDIVGGGEAQEEIKEYIEKNNLNGYKIQMLGETNDVAKIMDEYDVVMGIGRCILEAIAMKKIAILSGIENIKGLIYQENIDKVMRSNFVGRELEELKPDDVAEQLNKINNKKTIQEITTNNYEKIRNVLDINDHIFFIKEYLGKYDLMKIGYNLINHINFLLEELTKEQEKNHEIWKAKVWFEEQFNIEKKKNENITTTDS